MSAIRKGYSTIKELPSEVRSSFDERDQEKWMEAYNSASETKSPEDAKVDAWMSMVDAPSSLAVETWGSVEVRDADGELVPIKTIEEYADKFIENGGLMHDSHSNVPMGTVWDYEVRKHPETGQDGIVFYFNVYRDGEVFERARDDILSGRKNAVSIGAEAPRGGYKCDDRGCYVERDVTDLYELSICETPANPEAYFIAVGKDIAKSKEPMKGEQIRIGIKDIVVHQDYTTCPLQKAKHDLLNVGFKNIHIKDDVVIAKSVKNEYKLFKAISKMGYPFRYNLTKQQFEIMPDYSCEKAIEEAIENGWAHEDNIGHVTLTKEIPKEVFIDFFERGFIVKIGDFYCLKADDVAKEDVKKSDYSFLLSTVWSDLNQAFYDVCRKNDIYIRSMSDITFPIFTDECKEFINTYYEKNGYSGSTKKDVKKEYIPDMTERYPEGMNPSIDDDVARCKYCGKILSSDNIISVHGDKAEVRCDCGLKNDVWLRNLKKTKKKVKKSEKDMWDSINDEDMNFIERVVDFGTLIDTERTEQGGTAYIYEYQGQRYAIIEQSDRRDSYGNVAPWMELDKSAKKKVKKDGGAMGVGDAGATNAVYGKRPQSLIPTGDKKYGKKRKAKKELYDDGNIHYPKAKVKQ